jgi:hypothetical protein
VRGALRAAPEEFVRAVQDYRWLLDRAYPAAATIKLIGDRYRLDTEERLILFRGVASAADSANRRALQTAEVQGRFLLVDGYNQILSIMHYRDGRPVFLSTDGLLRDVGASHGRIPDRERFLSAMETFADALAVAGPARVSAVFDAPVSGSAEHAVLFGRTLRARGLPAESGVEKSADAPLKAAPAGAAVATGDSAVVDALAASGREVAVFDAARFAIDRAYGPLQWLDLASLPSEDPGRSP